MNGRGGVVTFFLFLLLSVIVLLQVLSMVESDPYQIWHSSQVEGRGSNRIGFDWVCFGRICEVVHFHNPLL